MDEVLLDCGHSISSHSAYGTYDGKTCCYSCCDEVDVRIMGETGRAVMYLTSNHQAVISWSGTLILLVKDITIGRHNRAHTRYDVWFDFEGWEWHGVRYGDNTELVHCKRTKRKVMTL